MSWPAHLTVKLSLKLNVAGHKLALYNIFNLVLAYFPKKLK
jgi:hypothetical protein